VTPVTTAPLFKVRTKNRRSRSGVNQCPMPYTYREDTGKKDQGRVFLDEGFAPPVPDEDGPTIMAATAPMTAEDNGTYKTLRK
jgi:hypothetical protein